MKQTFQDWTTYDLWLTENYAGYLIFEITEESDGKITVEYEVKEAETE